MSVRGGPENGRSPGIDPPGVVAWVEHLARAYPFTGVRGIDRTRPGLEAEALILAFPRPWPVTGPSSSSRKATARQRRRSSSRNRWKRSSWGSPPGGPVDRGVPDRAPGRIDIVRRLLQRALSDASRQGARLVIFRVDADDVETLVAAQSAGLTVQEATITFLADAGADAPSVPLPLGLSVEVHEGDVRGVLGTEDVDLLSGATSAWELNHFRADPRLTAEAVQQFYKAWVHNIASGDWSDCLFVARRNGRVVGIMSELTDRQLLARAGTALRVCEWVVVAEAGSGAGSARWRPQGDTGTRVALTTCGRPSSGTWRPSAASSDPAWPTPFAPATHCTVGPVTERLPDVSVVVPMLDAETRINELYQPLADVLAGMGRASEIILVDDGSTDGTWMAIERLAAVDPGVNGVRLAGNVGQTSALCAGFSVARGRLVVIMDDDLETDPAGLLPLLAAVEAGADFASGWRKGPRPWVRTLGSRALQRSTPSMGSAVPRCWMRVQRHDRDDGDMHPAAGLVGPPASIQATCGPADRPDRGGPSHRPAHGQLAPQPQRAGRVLAGRGAGVRSSHPGQVHHRRHRGPGRGRHRRSGRGPGPGNLTADPRGCAGDGICRGGHSRLVSPGAPTANAA